MKRAIVHLKKLLVFMLVAMGVTACIDEVDLRITSTAQERKILIVEGTLTNEFKNHQIRLSQIDSLIDLQLDSVYNPFTPLRDIERNLVNYEENAQVRVEVSTGAAINFIEVSPGLYESSTAFAAESNTNYSLKVTTTNGKSFSSKAMTITGFSNLDSIYADTTISDSGAEGIGIFVDNSNAQGAAGNLRYDYTETYKVIAPNWSPQEFKLTNYDPCALPAPTYDLEIVPREEEQQVCYATAQSNTIIQNQLNAGEGGGSTGFLVRFLGKDNFSISHRYSILVRQLVSGPESFSFYEQLNNFSQTGSIFSQVQPGFLEGNLRADDGSQGTVIGFFDVVSVAQKRLFFNYTDFYPDEELPPYPFNCGLHSSPETHVSYCATGEQMNNCPQSVIERVNLDLISYVAPNDQNIGTCPGPHIYVPKICGDCRVLGSNVEPEFWTED
ncbi:MAG: DUF4249 domain-containing protein [Croceitalea sp.]|nr:DUF4249 domain-containing protein [Croceitalea sp.]